jgi:lactoylglutathione lyase
MPTRFWLSILLAILAGIAVLIARPTGRKQKSSVPWRGQIKPPPPPTDTPGTEPRSVTAGIAATQAGFPPRSTAFYTAVMNVERVKYVIWAAEMDRAVAFYTDLFGGRVLKQNTVIAEVEILGSVIGIHSGGEGKRTWTGLSFQVPDVIAGAREVVAAGGQVAREPEPENGEPPHLAMCVDPEGNEFMLSRKRA